MLKIEKVMTIVIIYRKSNIIKKLNCKRIKLNIKSKFSTHKKMRFQFHSRTLWANPTQPHRVLCKTYYYTFIIKIFNYRIIYKYFYIIIIF